MTMLAILAAFIIERFISDIDRFRTYRWFNGFIQWARQRFEQKSYWSDTPGILVILFIPVFSIAAFHQALAEQFALAGFIFSIAILLYCFGPKDIHESARLFIEARNHDDQHNARKYAADILGDDIPEEDSQLLGNISRALLVATNQRLLAVFFWFVILGPMGALLYRLTCVTVQESETGGQDHDDNMDQPSQTSDGFHQTAQRLYAILNWAPAHLTALCYAIIGSFVDALHEWQQHKSAGCFDMAKCHDMLVYTGLGSLRKDANSITFDESSLQDILDLGKRTIIVWLTALALITMAGWAV